MKLVKRMTMHLNGGGKFSELHYKILADGEDTGITWHERTTGSPDYRYTARELHHGDETLDLLENPDVDVVAWIKSRVARARGEGENDG